MLLWKVTYYRNFVTCTAQHWASPTLTATQCFDQLQQLELDFQPIVDGQYPRRPATVRYASDEDVVVWLLTIARLDVCSRGGAGMDTDQVYPWVGLGCVQNS